MPAFAGIYYVAMPPNGDDGHDGLSVDTAFKTIGKALNSLGQKHGRIQLMVGTYSAPKQGILLFAEQALHGVGGQATTITLLPGSHQARHFCRIHGGHVPVVFGKLSAVG